jgi:hypothetical protein
MKTKNIFIILGILVAVVLLVVGALYVFSPTTLSTITGTCIGGLNILISTASHSPGQEFFHGEATANLGAECFKIAWTEQDVEKYLAEGGDSEKGVFGDIVINSQTNTFHTRERDYEIIENYHIEPYSGFSLCRDSDCRNILNNAGIEYRRLVTSNSQYGVYGCRCIYTMERGRFAPFTGGRERHFEATISIDGLGSEKISDEIQSVSFGNQAFFQWQGSLLGTRWIDTPFAYTPFREGNIYSLTSTSHSDLGSTRVYVANSGNPGYFRLDEIDNCIKGTAYMSDVRRCINVYDGKADELLNDRTNYYANSIGFVTGANWDVDEGDLVVDLEPYSTTYPRFTFDINAAWLGIKYLIGEPKVNCPNDQEGFSGETRQFDLEVTNVGDGSGVFALSLDCGVLAETISPDRVSLVSGASETIRGTAKGTTEQEKEDTCTFLAYALKNPSIRDSCSFTYSTKPRAVCLPGVDRRCSTDKQYLLICNDLGTGYDEHFCVQNCIYDVKEGAKCAEDPSCKEEDGTCTEDKDCCSGLECRGNVCKPIKPGWQWDNLYFLPILLTLGLAGLFGWRAKQKTGKYNWIDFAIGGALGLGAGIGAYFILKHWVMVSLIALIGGGGAIALILFLGGTPLLFFIFNYLFRRGK